MFAVELAATQDLIVKRSRCVYGFLGKATAAHHKHDLKETGLIFYQDVQFFDKAGNEIVSLEITLILLEKRDFKLGTRIYMSGSSRT